MSGFIQGQARTQSTLFPEMLDDFVIQDSAVRVIDFFIDNLNLAGLGFQTEPTNHTVENDRRQLQLSRLTLPSV